MDNPGVDHATVTAPRPWADATTTDEKIDAMAEVLWSIDTRLQHFAALLDRFTPLLARVEQRAGRFFR